MGFSTIGLFIAICVFAPNLLMIIFPPKNIPPQLKNAGIVFTVFERIGQISCLLLLVISKSNFQNREINLWFILAVISIACYIGLWIRYVFTGRDFATLFKPAIIPIPMAVFPILAFGFIAIWGKSPWLGITDILFALGHTANSWNTYSCIK